MTLRLTRVLAGVLLLACGACASGPGTAPVSACAATARHAALDPRIRAAVVEARRQNALFGGQVIERDGGIFHAGFDEAEWSRMPGESLGAWQRVASFWRALSDSEPPLLLTSRGWISPSDALRESGAGTEGDGAAVAVREALLRAAIIDTPWSATFISYLMKTAGLSRDEFAFSDSHADYVQGAFEASAAEAAGRAPPYAFRACDVATTPPRAGDLLCATRADTAGIARFDALAAALAARSPGQPFPMHCDLVVRADEGGDAGLESIGGNVVQSVTLTRMTLNARRVLGEAYIGPSSSADCARAAPPCRERLNRRPWSVVLQFRN